MGVAPHQIPADVDDQAAMLRTLLARKRMLVLLDNAATAQQVRPLLPGSPTCAVVVTSRNDLAGLVVRDGAHRVPLDVLNPSDSIAVLAGAIGAERVRAEPAAAARLARLCGGLPLSLRIAAERVAGQPRKVSLAELAAELGPAPLPLRDLTDVVHREGDPAAVLVERNLPAVGTSLQRALREVFEP